MWMHLTSRNHCVLMYVKRGVEREENKERESKMKRGEHQFSGSLRIIAVGVEINPMAWK